MVDDESIRTLRVAARRTVARDVIEFELEPVDGATLPEWQPGAHIDLRLGADMIRQYSLVPSRARTDTWTVAVLIEPDGRGGSVLIERTLQEGATVKVSGPRNHFALGEGPYLFVAGGIGITPLLAMAAAAEADGAEWSLAYLGRDEAAMAYLGDLRERYGARIESFPSNEGMRFDVSSRLASTPAETHVYCCGPDRLMDAIEVDMTGRGRVDRVHLERFHPREIDAAFNHEFTVYATQSDIEFVVPEDESILMAADFEGILVPGDCLEGTCGSCETRVLLGEVEHRDSVLGPVQRARSETMMICVSRAKPGCARIELDL